MDNAYIYTRVSTLIQVDGFSLDAQEEEIRALAKQYDYVLPYLQQQLLSPWVHNKTIQKAIESYRISDEQKMYLRTLKQSTRK